MATQKVGVVLYATCRPRDAVVCFTGTCRPGSGTFGPLAGLSVRVTCDGQPVASGSTGPDGCFPFTTTCYGQHKVSWDATYPFRSGSLPLDISFCPQTPPQRFSTNVPWTSQANLDLSCCFHCGPVKRQLYATDDFGTWSLSGDALNGWGATSKGTRDQVGNTYLTEFNKQATISPDSCLCCLHPCPNVVWPGPTEDACAIATSWYNLYSHSVMTVNTGQTAVGYNLSCGSDGGGPYFQLSLFYPAQYGTTYEYGWTGTCCLPPQNPYPPGFPCGTLEDIGTQVYRCDTVVSGGQSITVCVLDSGPNPQTTCKRQAFYQAVADGQLGGLLFTANVFLVAKKYVDPSFCTGASFNLTFDFSDPSTYNCAFASPSCPVHFGYEEDADCGQAGHLVPPPPAGTSIVVSS